MPSVCNCPFCGQPTAIPENLDSDSVVRCPLCDFEYSGDEALLNAVEAPPEHVAELPPELILVEVINGASAAEFLVQGSAANETDYLGSTADIAGLAAADFALVSVASAASEARDLLALPTVDTSAPEAMAPTNEDALGPDPAAAATLETTTMLVESAAVSVVPAATTTQSVTTAVEASSISVETAQTPDDTAPPSADATIVTVSSETAMAELPAGAAEHVEPVAVEAVAEKEHEPVLSSLGLRVPGEVGAKAPAAIRPQRRKGNPVRTFVGSVIFGLLGLATAYGLMTGISRLGSSGGSRPAVVESDKPQAETKSAKGQSKEMSSLPRPKSFDEWPDLDQNRFTGASNDVQPTKSGKAAKRPGDRKGP